MVTAHYGSDGDLYGYVVSQMSSRDITGEWFDATSEMFAAFPVMLASKRLPAVVTSEKFVPGMGDWCIFRRLSTANVLPQSSHLYGLAS